MAIDAKPESTAVAVKNDKMRAVERELERFPDSQFNRIVPAVIQEVSDLMTPQAVVVRVNPDRDAGDVYPTPGQSGKFSLHKTALDRIASAVGVSWVESKRVDDRKDPLYIEWQARGRWTMPTGETGDLLGTYDLDLNDNGVVFQDLLREQLRQQDNGRQKWTPEQAERNARERLSTMRRRMVPLAESGAKNRATRSIGLRSSYSAMEIQKPFVFVRFVPNTNDPDVKNAVLDRLRGGVREVYGPVVAAEVTPALADAVQEGEFREEAARIEPTRDVGDELEPRTVPRATATTPEPEIPDDAPGNDDGEQVAAIAAEIIKSVGRSAEAGKPADEDLLQTLGVVIRDVLGIPKKTSVDLKSVRLSIARLVFGAQITTVTQLTTGQARALVERTKELLGQEQIKTLFAYALAHDAALADAKRELGR